jgi:Raf kinase inhibitor-like YbhB/YbcL family protein
MPLNIQDLKITSQDFEAGSAIDRSHSLDDENHAPRLTISGVPREAAELAVICHDPDAPLPQGFTHWTLYGIPPRAQELGSDADSTYRPGPNGAGTRGYIGPQPPAGHGPHHYYFWVYALDTKVDGTPTREEFLSTYGSHIVEQNRLVGSFENQPSDAVR